MAAPKADILDLPFASNRSYKALTCGLYCLATIAAINNTATHSMPRSYLPAVRPVRIASKPTFLTSAVVPSVSAIADIDSQRAAQVATQLTSIGGDVIWVELDITEQSSVARALNEVTTRLGPIDVAEVVETILASLGPILRRHQLGASFPEQIGRAHV